MLPGRARGMSDSCGTLQPDDQQIQDGADGTQAAVEAQTEQSGARA